jgi:PAS domain S-box-containing protein
VPVRPEIDALQLIEAAGDGIWIVDPASVTRYVNDAMGAMLGYRADEPVGRPVSDFVVPDERARVPERLERRGAGHVDRYTSRLVHRDGGTVWTLISAAPSPGGGSVAKVVDITGHHTTEAALLAREAELRTAGELQDGMLQRLVLAWYAIDRGDTETGQQELARALSEARQLIGDLMAGDEPRPGAPRRTGAA